MLADPLDAEVKRWSSGKEGNLRALLSTLQYVCRISQPVLQTICLCDLSSASVNVCVSYLASNWMLICITLVNESGNASNRNEPIDQNQHFLPHI